MSDVPDLSAIPGREAGAFVEASTDGIVRPGGMAEWRATRLPHVFRWNVGGWNGERGFHDRGWALTQESAEAKGLAAYARLMAEVVE